MGLGTGTASIIGRPIGEGNQYRVQRLTTLPSVKELWTNGRSILSIGIPAAATNLISPLSVGLITSMLARYGPEAVAGFGVASRVEAMSLIVPLAISVSIGPFVGQNWGAQQYGRISRALRLSSFFCLAWGVVVAVVLGTSAEAIASGFDSQPAVIASASRYLTIVPISYGALGVVLVFSSAFNALGKPLLSIVMAITRLLFLYLPLAYLGSQWFGVSGIFTAACLSNGAIALGTFLWYRRSNQLKAEVKLEQSLLRQEVSSGKKSSEPQLSQTS
jgi:Na+-driven multidrug efflux pump